MWALQKIYGKPGENLRLGSENWACNLKYFHVHLFIRTTLKFPQSILSPLPTPLALGFHIDPHWIDVNGPRDIRLFTIIGSMLVSGNEGWSSSTSNLGVYGSSILILPHLWKNNPIAPTQRMRTKITMKASSGRTMILLPVNKGRWMGHKSTKC